MSFIGFQYCTVQYSTVQYSIPPTFSLPKRGGSLPRGGRVSTPPNQFTKQFARPRRPPLLVNCLRGWGSLGGHGDGVLGCFYCFLTWDNNFVTALSCYECDSSNNFTCTERWDPNEPTVRKYLNIDCAHVFEAKYCVKMIGIYDGKLGTKRFCSSKDWGNYCEYIQRPGDVHEYRACIFSCSRSECNTASETIKISRWTIYMFALTTILYQFIGK